MFFNPDDITFCFENTYVDERAGKRQTPAMVSLPPSGLAFLGLFRSNALFAPLNHCKLFSSKQSYWDHHVLASHAYLE